MNATLEIIIGPMFSGKSFEIIARIRSLKVLEKKFLVLKPVIDDRYSKESVICTHNYDKESCVSVKNLFDCIDDNFVDYNTIFIDEAQFFNDLKDFVLKCLEEYNINYSANTAQLGNGNAGGWDIDNLSIIAYIYICFFGYFGVKQNHKINLSK